MCPDNEHFSIQHKIAQKSVEKEIRTAEKKCYE